MLGCFRSTHTPVQLKRADGYTSPPWTGVSLARNKSKLLHAQKLTLRSLPFKVLQLSSCVSSIDQFNPDARVVCCNTYRYGGMPAGLQFPNIDRDCENEQIPSPLPPKNRLVLCPCKTWGVAPPRLCLMCS